MPQEMPRMPQDSPAHDETDPNPQAIDEFRASGEQPQLLSYQAMTDREVPVIVLTPARPSLAPRSPRAAAADVGSHVPSLTRPEARR
jgi:hypothetical protein